jgi:uncharacterized surface protein with fasciclin (FAS1) repeats
MIRSALKFVMATFLLVSCDTSAPPEQNSTTADSPRAGQSAVMDSESNPNVVQVAVNSPDHTTLVAALKAANYVDALSNVGPFTVFAPTDEAFDKLPKGTVETLTRPENQRELRDILEYHVLLGVYREGDFVDGRSMGTADGRNVVVTKDPDGNVKINGAKIIGTVAAANGIIHVVDQVLLPE